MWTTFLTKRKGTYKALHFINFLAILIAPFFNSHLYAIDEGGGTEKEQEKTEMLLAVQNKIKEALEKNNKGLYTKEELDKKLDSINKEIADNLDNNQIKELKDSVDKMVKSQEEMQKSLEEQGLALKEMQENGGNKTPLTFREAIKRAILEKKDILLTEKKDDNGERLSLKDFFTEKGNQQSPVITIKNGTDLIRKVSVDMTEANIVQSNVSTVRLTQLDPQRVGIPLTIYPHVLDVIPTKRISRPYMSLLVVYSYEDGAGTKTEGSAGSKSSFLLKTVEFKAFYINTHFILSDETLDDLEEVLDEIALVAPDKILDSIDSKILADAGDGSTDIQGLLVGGTTCTDFVASTYSESTEGANLVDLIAKMKLAVRKGKYIPNVVKLNSTDIDRIQCLKDALDNSISDRRLVFNQDGDLVRIAGLRVIENDKITANTCVVGANTQAMIGIRKEMTMEIGYNSTDLTEGQKTVMFKIRLAFGVRDKAAWQYSSDMDGDLTTITKANA